MAKRKVVYRYMQPTETTGIVKVFDYLIGYVILGIVWFILDDPVNILSTTVGPFVSNNEWVLYLWGGSLVAYMIFGTMYFLASVRED